ncbi:MAG: hypothetical protein IH851_04820 [Armatimonadetes bacterium]|nr:hypothetical protein [Armatimonadota bacterium]
MVYRKTNFHMSITLAAAMLLVTATASFQATTVPVAGDQFTLAVLDPGRSWVDEEGITHVRGLILEVAFIGDLVGTVIQHLNYNIDPFGDGDLHGSAEFDGALIGVGAGALVGRFAGDISGGVFTVESIGRGTLGGARAHSRVTTTGVLGSGVAMYTGIVRFPQGQ